MENNLLWIDGGYSTLRAWQKGQLQQLIDQGLSLNRAKLIARPVFENTVHNLVTNAGKILLIELMIDEESVGLTYHTIGTSSTTPVVGDTTLTTEVQRKLFAFRGRSGYAVGLSCFYTAAQCTYAIEECGIFGGATATAVADSGVLFSHYLQPYDNSAGNYDLTFDYLLTLKREGEA